MRFSLLFSLISLLPLSLAQSTSSVGSLAATSPTAVTVTSISTLAIVILPSSNSSSIPSSSASTELTTTTASSSTSILLPTTPYTGQAILVGTCNIPQYTGLALQDGAVIEVPLVGCSDDRPECCPSLSSPESVASTLTVGPPPTATPDDTGLVATGVISMLSASPLSICPHDFVDIDPVCCPSGYSLYSAIVGNTPCYSMLSTVIPIPTAVSNSITSAVALTATSATATVSVIINQVFALGLPCANEKTGGLSTGAKAGIGVGAGVGGLLLIALTLFVLVRIGKKRLRRRQPPAPPPMNAGYYQPQEKHISASTGPVSTLAGVGSPYMGHESHFQSGSIPYSLPTTPGVQKTQPHGSWGSQPTTIPPYNPPVEMRVPETYEIGAGERAASPRSPGMISSGDSNALTSSLSASEARQERVD